MRSPSLGASSRIVTCLLSAALLLASGCSSGPVSNETEGSPSVTIGETDATTPAPVATPVTVEMVDVAGYEAAIAKHKGKVVVVDFWATWCEPCVERFPHIVEMSQQFSKDDIAFVSVSLDLASDKEKVVKFLTEQKAESVHNLLTTLDVTEAFDAYDIRDGIPNYKVYDREGKLKYLFALSENASQEVLAADDLDIKVRELLSQ